MEIANIIMSFITLLGVGFSIYYQKTKIDALKNTIESQKDIIDSIKVYKEIVDIKSIKEFVQYEVEHIKSKSDEKITKIKTDYELKNEQLLKSEKYNKFIKDIYVQSFLLNMALLPNIPKSISINEIHKIIMNETLKEMLLSFANDVGQEEPSLLRFLLMNQSKKEG